MGLKSVTVSLALAVANLAFAQNFWEPINNGFTTTSGIPPVRGLVVTSAGVIFAATADGGFRSTTRGNSWEYLASTGGQTIQSIALGTSDILFAGTDAAVFRSTDIGSTWTPVGSGLPEALMMAIGFNDAGDLFTGTDLEGLYRSTNQGSSWSPVTAGLTSLNIVSFLNHGNGVLLVGTDGQGVFRSTDSGNSWSEVNNGLKDLYVRAMACTRGGPIFCGTNAGGVFRSTDGGVNWIETNSNLTAPFIASLLVYPLGTVCTGTSGGGFFQSANNGDSWTERNTGLDDLLVYALAGDSSGYLYAGTIAGGMFRSVLPFTALAGEGPGVPGRYVLEQNYPNPFNPETEIRFQIPDNGLVMLTVYDLLGREVGVLVNEEKEPGIYAVRFNGSRLSSGVYFYRLLARPLEAGSSGDISDGSRIRTEQNEFVQTRKLILTR